MALGRRLLAITLAIMSGGTAWAGSAPTGPLRGVETWAVNHGAAPETAAELARFEYLTFASQPMVPEDQPAATS